MPPAWLCVHQPVTSQALVGFPHSDILGSQPGSGSPRPYAACPRPSSARHATGIHPTPVFAFLSLLHTGADRFWTSFAVRRPRVVGTRIARFVHHLFMCSGLRRRLAAWSPTQPNAGPVRLVHGAREPLKDAQSVELVGPWLPRHTGARTWLRQRHSPADASPPLPQPRLGTASIRRTASACRR